MIFKDSLNITINGAIIKFVHLYQHVHGQFDIIYSLNCNIINGN